MAIDTEKLHAILTAAQNPAFKKLIDERAKKLEEKAKLETEISGLDEKIAESIPAELLVLLTPPASAKSARSVKSRKPADFKPEAQSAIAVESAAPALEVALEEIAAVNS